MPGRRERLSQMNMPSRLSQKTHRVWAILCLAVKKFMREFGGHNTYLFFTITPSGADSR